MTRLPPWLRTLAGGGALLAASFLLYLHGGHGSASPPADAVARLPLAPALGVDAPPPAAAAVRTGVPTPKATHQLPASGPQRLVIPALSLAAVVEDVTVDAHGRMDVPRDPADAGWYAAGPQPGQPGDAVIDGHLDWYGQLGVFRQLGQLHAGDLITVEMAGGTHLDFTVTGTSVVSADATPPQLFSTAGPRQLSLLTCTGAWDAERHRYTERLVVTAALRA